MIISQKILHFQYVLDRLLKWYGDDMENDISTLKALKLLFFVAAAGSEEPDSLVENVFDDFHALPLGHVESAIYSEIKKSNGEFDFFRIDNFRTTRKELDIQKLVARIEEKRYISKIDSAIDFLEAKYPDLIKYNPSDLVELSHLWYSWRKNYNQAIVLGRRSNPIEFKDIISESKIFNLQLF